MSAHLVFKDFIRKQKRTTYHVGSKNYAIRTCLIAHAFLSERRPREVRRPAVLVLITVVFLLIWTLHKVLVLLLEDGPRGLCRRGIPSSLHGRGGALLPLGLRALLVRTARRTAHPPRRVDARARVASPRAVRIHLARCPHAAHTGAGTGLRSVQPSQCQCCAAPAVRRVCAALLSTRSAVRLSSAFAWLSARTDRQRARTAATPSSSSASIPSRLYRPNGFGGGCPESGDGAESGVARLRDGAKEVYVS
mmetsp:Transcript_42164/g.92426  ORF Transcript_42164/g.92426 Transcript_42164/m.92426 type:complete len:250 (-) Transcript_42164:83-832(-)